MSNLIRWEGPESGTRWNRVRLYRAPTEIGVYTNIKEFDISYTYYWDENAPHTDFYKVAFYDSILNIETAPSDAYSTSTIPMISPGEVRVFMALSPTQAPDDTTLLSLMIAANTEMLLDINFAIPSAKKVALKYITASYVSQWRAQNIINSGNVNFAIDGVSVQKPFKDFMEQAKYYRQMYDDFIWKFADEVMATYPIWDSGYEDYSIFLVDIMNGANNARNALDLHNIGNQVAYVSSP